MKRNINKDINYDSDKFFHNLERQKKTNVTLPSMSSNKCRTPNKRRNPELKGVGV